MNWKPMATAFSGGTDAARKLYGKRINVVVPFHEIVTYDPTKPGNQGPKISVRVGTQGFVGKVPDQDLASVIIALPHGGTAPASIEALTRQPFHAIRVNWATLRNNFQIAG